MKFLVPLLFALPLLGAGCNNSCQQICVSMKKFAKDCGIEIDSSEMSECISRQAGKASRDNRAACRDFGDLGSIEEEWTCDDIAEYWAAAAPAEELEDE